MTRRLHVLLFALTALLLGQAVCTAQAPAETAQVELIVPKGTQYVNFEVTYLDGAEASNIDFGDGTIEPYNGRYRAINHKYATKLTEETVIKIDAAQLTQLRNTSAPTGFSGFGKIVAPELQTLRLGMNNYTLRDSREQMVDLSACPKLKEVFLYNVPGIKLPTERTALKKVTITSPANTSDRNYATLSNKHLDLSGYTALSEVSIQYQPNLKTVDLTGAIALTKLTLNQCNLYKIDGIKELAALTDVNLSGNYLPYSSLPLKRPALKTFKYGQEGVRLAPECVDKNTIHLADMLEVKDADSAPQLTTLKQVKQLNTPRTLKEGQDYILKGSDLIILERGFGGFGGDNPLDSIQLSIKTTNAYYPDYGKSKYEDPELKLDIAREGAVYPGEKQKLTFSAGEGGTIKAMAGDTELITGAEVEPGTPLTFTATPNEGYMITEWRVNDKVQMTPGLNKKPVTDATFKVNMYSEPMTVTVTFAKAGDNYAVTFSKEGEGKLTATVDGKPLTSGTFVAKGTKVLFEAKAFTNNIVKEWQVNDKVIPEGKEQASYTLTVDKTSDVKVIFAVHDAIDAITGARYQIAQTAQTLTVLGATAGETIRLYTLTGTPVATATGDATLPIAQLPAGVYLLQIGNDWVKVTL
ncbi:T9SS C-terminal target domain-containing protein [uncultured Porphyromonas sp.]|uniref:InlB B-repeat-containing protein n=1 Tax=uncultured Porphyromonas sp. TaxID=159274 RepID=UPI0028065960|nr:T9SS C-terminal target domain-containing protein [uncultured Porphyromonas sp.]